MDKKSLRYLKLKERNSICKKDKKNLDKKINEILENDSDIINSKILMAYLSKNNEVDITEFIRKNLESKKIVIPYMENNLMKTSIIEKLEDLKLGKFGILEPKNEKTIPINPKKIDTIIVPGIAFDETGNRIGYGKGFYDKFLSNLNVKKIAVSFECQICSKITADIYDIKMNKIITEKRIIIPRSG